MKTDPFNEKEKAELVTLARAASEEESPWVQLGEYFRNQRGTAKEVIEPRPIRETK